MYAQKKAAPILGFYLLIVSLFLTGTLLGNRILEAASEIIPIERKNRIVIDAGHGGEDGGAVSCSGKNESHFNLQIALRLNDLMRFLGYDTVMIRKTDTAVHTDGQTIAQKKVSDLKHRVQIVRQTQNAILLSIHQNTFPESKYTGAQVFYAKTPGSETLAEMLQEQLISAVNPQSHRMAKEGSGIYLLDKIPSTGILVECGFLSNPQEEAILQTPDYQKKLCCIIGTTVSTYLSSS